MTKCFLNCIVGCTLVLLLGSPAWAALTTDNFDDNTRDTGIWPTAHSDEYGVVAETNGRLEYTSTQTAADENAAKFVCGQSMSYDSTWTLTFDAHLGDYGLTAADHEYAVELGVHNASGTGDNALFLSLVRGRDESGTAFFVWQAMNECGENEDGWDADASQEDGSLKLVWNEDDAHLFKAYYRQNESGDWTVLNDAIDISAWGMDSSDLFAVGLGGFDMGTEIALNDGAKMYADNFSLNVVPEPATMSLLAVVALGILRKRRRN